MNRNFILALVVAVVAWLATWMIGMRGGFMGPAYVGTVLTLVLIVVVPGWLLSRWLGLHDKVPWPGAMALWFALGMGTLEVVASLGRALHLHVRFTVLALAVLEGALLLNARRSLSDRPTRKDDITSPTIRFKPTTVLLSLAALGGLVGIVFAADRLAVFKPAPSADLWLYSTYSIWYLRHPDLPFTPRQVFDSTDYRLSSSGWLFANSVVAWAQPVEPTELILTLTPILAPIGLAAVFLLGYEVSDRKTDIALLSVALTTDFYLLGILAASAAGPRKWASTFFLHRLGEDKSVTFFILLPVALSLAYRYVRDGESRLFVPLGLVSMALALTHALGVAAYGICLAGFGLFHALVAPHKAEIRRLLVVVLLTIPAVGFTAAQAHIVHRALGFDALSPGGPAVYLLTYRQNRGPDSINLDLALKVIPPEPIFSAKATQINYILDDDLLNAPLLRLSLWASVLLAIGSRRRLSTHLLSGITLFSLFVLYTPGVTPLLGRFTTPLTLWRFLWMIPVGPVLAMTLAGVVDYLAKRFRVGSRPVWRSLPSIVALVYAAAIFGPGSLLARLEQDHSLLLDQAPTPEAWGIVVQIAALGDEDPLILAPPDLNGILNGLEVGRVFYLKEQAAPAAYVAWHKRFYDSTSPPASVDQQTLDVLQEFEFDYLVMPREHPANDDLLASPDHFPIVAENGAYYVYGVNIP
jgi:hypothetical protein